MLSDNSAIATVAVKNLEAAKKFYEGTLAAEHSRKGNRRRFSSSDELSVEPGPWEIKRSRLTC